MRETVTLKTAKRIDTQSAPEFQKEMEELLDRGEDNIRIDMQETSYISSIGLRVLLSAQKRLHKIDGALSIVHVGATVMEVFDITGYSGFLNIGADE